VSARKPLAVYSTVAPGVSSQKDCKAMRYITAPFRFLIFIFCLIAYSAYLAGNELSIPIRKWWRRKWPMKTKE
jgi:hypothetical protein